MLIGLGVYMGLLLLRAMRFPVIKEIPWKFLVLWPLITGLVMLIVRVFSYVFYLALFIAGMYFLIWLFGYA